MRKIGKIVALPLKFIYLCIMRPCNFEALYMTSNFLLDEILVEDKVITISGFKGLYMEVKDVSARRPSMHAYLGSRSTL